MKVIKTLTYIGLLATLGLHANESQIGATLHQKFELALHEIPNSALNAVKSKYKNVTITEAEKELKHGHTYIDIEGKDAEGNDIEFDLMQVGADWKIVEIQRDLTLAQTPTAVIAELKKHHEHIQPKRIIESVQVEESDPTNSNDVIIYEFYTVSQQGEESKHEIKWHQGQAHYLTKEWQH